MVPGIVGRYRQAVAKAQRGEPLASQRRLRRVGHEAEMQDDPRRLHHLERARMHLVQGGCPERMIRKTTWPFAHRCPQLRRRH